MGALALPPATALPAAAAGGRTLIFGGTTTIVGTPLGADAILQFPEFPSLFLADPDAAPGTPASGPAPAPIVNREQSSGHPGHGHSDNGHGEDRNIAQVLTSFEGLNHRDQRLANGGNQFSLEPPDQGLCVGNGFVLETVNDVLNVYDAQGKSLKGITDLNSFYHYPAAINRTTGARGPFVTDPSCLFDPATQRWFHIVLTLDVVPTTGALIGTNHLDLAVSQTASPLGAWNIYRFAVQDDGTDGTPNHHCDPGPGAPNPTHPNACIGDFPHIGADAFGFYITTNEYALFGEQNFHAAQLYAISKQALAAGAQNPEVTQIDTLGLVGGRPGFTLWPATSPAGDNGARQAAQRGGIEYFLSSNAAEEANPGCINDVAGDCSSNQIIAWALTNTGSLGGANPDVRLVNDVVPVDRYAVPPASDQKAGDFPLGQCINDTSTPIPGTSLVGCWRALFAAEPSHKEVESRLDSSDSRMLATEFVDNKLIGLLDTAVTVGGHNRAGVAWFIVRPTFSDGNSPLRADLQRQGVLAEPNNNITYGDVGVLTNGQGVMGFTLVGRDHFPSAAYVTFDAEQGVSSSIHIIAEGQAAQDGFTGYKAIVGNPPRPRWGDYGMAAYDGDTVWIANEYIAHACTFQQYIAVPFGSCAVANNGGGTRTILANWSTRITHLKP